MLCLLFYRAEITGKSTGQAFKHKDFGFKKNGTFSIEFKNTTSEKIFIGMLNENESKNIGVNTISKLNPCIQHKLSISAINNTVIINDGGGIFCGKIPMDNVYTPFIMVCTPEETEYSIIFTYKNGKSLIDTRWQSAFIALPIVGCVLLIILVLAIFNQARFWKGVNKMHIFLDVVILVGLGSIVLNYFHLKQMEKTDNTYVFSIIRTILEVAFYIVIFVFLLLLANGWTVINKELSILEFIEIFAYTILFIIVFVIHNYVETLTFGIILFFAFIVLLALLWWTLLSVMRSVDRIIRAHMLVISRASINPKTTPVYIKHVAYMVFIQMLVAYFSLWIALLSLELASVLRFWLQETLEWSLNSLILAASLYLFRVRFYNVNGYTALEQSADQVALDEIPKSASLYDQENGDLVDWEAGMLLPAEPIVVEEGGMELRLVPL